MRTIARETTFKIALRYCSKGTEGKVSIYVILVKREYMQSSTFFFFLQVSASLMKVIANLEKHMSPWRVFSAFLDMRRYKGWIHKIGSWRYLTVWRTALPVSPSTQCFISEKFRDECPLFWTPFRRCWKSEHDLILIEADGKCQYVAVTRRLFFPSSGFLSLSITKAMPSIFVFNNFRILPDIPLPGCFLDVLFTVSSWIVHCVLNVCKFWPDFNCTRRWSIFVHYISFMRWI